MSSSSKKPTVEPNDQANKVNVQIGPRGTLDLLSQLEVRALTSTAAERKLLDLFSRCALAVLNTGNETDDAAALFDEYADFDIEVARRTRGGSRCVQT